MSLPKFRIRTLMIVVALIASALISPSLTTLVALLGASGVAIRSLLRTPAGARDWPVPYFVTLACLYLPFSWVVLEWPWDGYQWSWIQLWPVLPGLIVGIFFHTFDTAMAFVSGTVSLLLVVIFTALGSLGRVPLVVSNLLALIGAGLESRIAYELFLM